MLKITALSVFVTLVAILPFSSQAEPQKEYVEIEWMQLMPADDLEALLNPPEFITDIQDGSADDSVDALKAMGKTDETTKRFKAALTSSRVIEAFDNKSIRVPGFIVPLQSDENQRVTEFFIVPYFGACLHLPPPPPNQIIFAKSEEGVELASLQDPFWFEGTIVITQTSNELGSSAYSINLDNVFPF